MKIITLTASDTDEARGVATLLDISCIRAINVSRRRTDGELIASALLDAQNVVHAIGKEAELLTRIWVALDGGTRADADWCRIVGVDQDENPIDRSDPVVDAAVAQNPALELALAILDGSKDDVPPDIWAMARQVATEVRP